VFTNSPGVGRVVPPKQQAEWMALVSQTTGKPITDVSPDDKGYSLGLAKGIFGPLGAVWYYKGMSLGYRGPAPLSWTGGNLGSSDLM
jgi:hypothetical protein